MSLFLPRIPGTQFFITAMPVWVVNDEFNSLFQLSIDTNTAVLKVIEWWNRSETLRSSVMYDLFPANGFSEKKFKTALDATSDAARNFDLRMQLIFQRVACKRPTEEEYRVLRAFVATPTFHHYKDRAAFAKRWAETAIPQTYSVTTTQIHDRFGDEDLRPLLQDYPSSKK